METSNTQNTKICPTCGTRAASDAKRCLVCATEFDTAAQPAPGIPEPAIRGSRMPRLTLSLPITILIFILFFAIGGGIVYLSLNLTGGIAEPTPLPTNTTTPTASLTPTPQTPTATSSPMPTPTPLTYTVASGDTCGGIAAFFDISIQAILLNNNLGAYCSLVEGQVLEIPNPTPTITPLATNTPSDPEATRLACETELITVQEGDTLDAISEDTGVSVIDIMRWNGKPVETVFPGEILVIPLCLRGNPSTIGTATPSPIPPFIAPSPLLPRNGQAFDLSHDSVTLQWTSIGPLNADQYYQVTIIDLTSEEAEPLVAEVKDSTFILTADYRPDDAQPHAFEWFVIPVTLVGEQENGTPIFINAGPSSERQIFIWSGSVPEATSAP